MNAAFDARRTSNYTNRGSRLSWRNAHMADEISLQDSTNADEINSHSHSKLQHELEVQQRMLEVRENQLSEMQEQTRSQMQKTVNLVKMVHERDDVISSLQRELENNRDHVVELQKALEQAQVIIDQQQDQLSNFRRIAAQSKTDADAFKLNNILLSARTGDHTGQVEELVRACERYESEVEALTWQLDQAKEARDRATGQKDILQQQLYRLKGDSAYEIGSSSEQETAQLKRRNLEQQLKKDIEKEERRLEMQRGQLEAIRIEQSVIRQQMQTMQSETTQDTESVLREAKQKGNNEMSWEMYACRLVRIIIENCDELLASTKYKEPSFSTAGERRWYNYSMRLLQTLLEVAPYRLVEMDMELLKGRETQPPTKNTPAKPVSEPNWKRDDDNFEIL